MKYNVSSCFSRVKEEMNRSDDKITQICFINGNIEIYIFSELFCFIFLDYLQWLFNEKDFTRIEL